MFLNRASRIVWGVHLLKRDWVPDVNVSLDVSCAQSLKLGVEL